MKKLTFANRWNADLIDENYQAWQENPNSLDPDWKAFFEGFELAQSTASTGVSSEVVGEASIIATINAYRTLGHTQAKINPLNPNPPSNPILETQSLGIQPEDLDKEFFTGNYLGGKTLPAKKIIQNLQETYCGSTGVEYMHIQDVSKRRWLEARMEPNNNQPNFSKEKKISILRNIYRGEVFESFLHTRYVGQKRFSLEGGETVIAALDAILELSHSVNLQEVVIGMAHRGRLNILANILGKSYDFIFKEFSANYIPESMYGDGDVKYHLGYEKLHKTQSGKEINIVLAPNPSHLEAVNPVVEGKVRARQRLRGDLEKRNSVLPILIHGDAAIAGQGIIAEVLNLAKLDGYRTGGTLHFVINNQIGFTTSPEQGRSTRYCTDIGKMLETPIFHVNGDDPLAVVQATELALQYRQEFGDDVMIDMYCYRKHGHNESDEPAFTQPTLYKQIKAHKPVSDHLRNRLISDGDLTTEGADQLQKEFEAILDKAFEHAKEQEKIKPKASTQKASPPQPSYNFNPTKTAVTDLLIQKVTHALTTVPDGFNINPKIKRQIEAKAAAIESGEGIDWGLGEALAYGTLLADGYPVRLSGQDSERGTFSHRHAVWYDSESRERYVPHSHIDKNQEVFCVHNSSLSEAAVLGYDYGYSLDYPKILCIWEAQFGDFANGAQVIFDQFIAPGESKWQSVSGITLLLPHGYEGQGPEHSSARLERYLQACAENNIQVCNATTPAQFFHLIRRQMLREFKKPLIIMSPKSLLRHKKCVSSVQDLTQGEFHNILDDNSNIEKPERVIFCSGKVFYDLDAYREENNITQTAIVRVEQLYPLHKQKLQELFKKYSSAKKFVWCQEEPKNMGAWSYIAPELTELLGKAPMYAGRCAAASPATGALAIHKVEQESLVETAFIG